MGDQRAKSDRIGVWMTNDIKIAMQRNMFTLVDTGRIAFAEDFVSQSIGMKGVICTQMRNYKFEFKPPTDAFSRPRMTLSGKGTGSNDDLCIVLQMLAFWGPVYYQHPRSVKDVDPVTEAE